MRHWEIWSDRNTQYRGGFGDLPQELQREIVREKIKGEQIDAFKKKKAKKNWNTVKIQKSFHRDCHNPDPDLKTRVEKCEKRNIAIDRLIDIYMRLEYIIEDFDDDDEAFVDADDQLSKYKSMLTKLYNLIVFDYEDLRSLGASVARLAELSGKGSWGSLQGSGVVRTNSKYRYQDNGPNYEHEKNGPLSENWSDITEHRAREELRRRRGALN